MCNNAVLLFHIPKQRIFVCSMRSQGNECVLFAQPQMCMAAYADMSTPLCFVKEACVCSLRSPRCAWPLMQTCPRPFALSRKRVCALCAAPDVHGRLMQTCPRPFALSRKRVCALCAAGNGVSGAEKGTHASLLFHSPLCMSETMHTYAQMFLRALSFVSEALARGKPSCQRSELRF
jgi:hypothetical protein